MTFFLFEGLEMLPFSLKLKDLMEATVERRQGGTMRHFSQGWGSATNGKGGSRLTGEKINSTVFDLDSLKNGQGAGCMTLGRETSGQDSVTLKNDRIRKDSKEAPNPACHVNEINQSISCGSFRLYIPLTVPLILKVGSPGRLLYPSTQGKYSRSH